MLLTFTFTISPDTQEATFAGNIEPQVALGILQQIVISEAIRKSKEATTNEQDKTTDKSWP